MKQHFEIICYVGAKPLLFGMTRSQAEVLVGPPEKTVDDLDGIDAMYKSFRIHYSIQDQRLVEVGFSKTAVATIRGINVFDQKNAFRDLVRQDSYPYESYGFIILFDLGITLTGFHDNDPDQLTITAFARGRLDDLKGQLRKFTVPK